MLLSYLSQFSLLLPVLAGLMTVKRFESGRHFLLLYFFIAGLVVEVISVVLTNKIQNNLSVLNIYFLIELVFWSLFFTRLIAHKILSGVVYLALIALTIQWIFFISNKNIMTFNYVFGMSESTMLIILSAIYLLKLSMTSYIPIQQIPEFWFSAGILLYCTNSIVGTGVMQFLYQNGKPDIYSFLVKLQYLYILFNIIANIIYTKAFLCISTRRISSW